MPKETPYWWEDAGAPEAPPEAALPAQVDVVTIGAGLTGLSAARTLARRGVSVAALDAGAPGIGASARNGGMIGGGHRLSLGEMERRYGPALAHRLMREALIDATAFATGTIAEEGIDCDYRETGRFRGFWTAAEYEAGARELEAVLRVIPVEAEMAPKARQREEIATDLYAGGVVYARHGGLNPAKYVKGLMVAAQRAGALVQGNTPVTGLARDGSGWRVETARGAIRAGQVLIATNGYTPGFLPEERRRITPVPSFIVTTERLGANRVRSLFPKGRMIVETRGRYCYYRPSPDGERIVFGGRAAMVQIPETLARRQLARLLAQIFPDLGAVDFTHSWRGLTGFTYDMLPHVSGRDGLWRAMGYCGNGNAMAPWLGHKAALGMLGDPDGETAFSATPFSIRWWAPPRSVRLAVADVALRLRDLREAAAKRREG